MKFRRHSSILARYLTGNFLLPLACSLLGFAALFLLNNFFDDIGDFLGKGVPVQTVVLYFLARQPQNLTNVIPISVLLAASFMTLMMGRHNELTAIRAAGLSLFSTAFPVWCLSLLASFVVFAINESWGPACAKKAEAIQQQYHRSQGKEKALCFHNPSQQRDWAIGVMGADGSAENINLRQYAENGSSEWLLVARRGRHLGDGRWQFENGFIKKDLEEKPHYFQEKTLALEETPHIIRDNSRDRQFATLGELRAILRSGVLTSRRALCDIRTRIWHKIFFPFVCLIAALFGVSMTVATDRMGLMKGFACAIGSIVLYYLCSELFLVFGKNGWVPPFIAGALPTLLFLGGALLAMRRKQ